MLIGSMFSKTIGRAISDLNLIVVQSRGCNWQLSGRDLRQRTLGHELS
jgi:hypothetical protein